jgi:hypothetical protein
MENFTKQQTIDLGGLEFTNGFDCLDIWHSRKRSTFSVHFNGVCIFVGSFQTARKHAQGKIDECGMWVEID